MPTTIESLELEVKQNGNSAVQGIDALSASLTRLKSATKGGMGLTSVATQIRNLNTALTSTDTSKIDKLTSSLEKLKSLGGLKISSSIASQLKNIGSAASSLMGVDFSGISQMSNAVSSLGGITKSAGLQSAITQLGKIPELAKTLNGVNWAQFTSQMQSLTNSLAPLASQLNTVSAAFARLPSNVRQLTQNTNSLATANNNSSKSYINLYAKLRMAITAVRSAARTIASWITQSNKYVEDLNLFTVSLGEYAASAKEYAEKVSELVGIDPADWLRNQGVFNTIIKGFGVASDKAIIMSKNLTQLGYDISSFYNISTEDAFTKLQSGIAGELEPLRRLGYDLSVARLQQEAYTLGINKSVSAMTQAEKSQLRYYAIMTQVKDAQGDMARTLNAPANQLRILQAQVTQCARALGNILIPALNAVLPYVIALAKVIRLIANAIASLFGFSLPKIDYSGLSAGAGAVAEAAESAEDGYGGAAKAAKKLKDNLLGIDELNIIRPDDDDSGSGSGAGIGEGGFDIDLPKYDFLEGLVESRVDGIVDKITGFFDEIKKRIEESGVIEAFNRLKEALSNFAESDFVKTMGEILNIIGDGVLTYGLDVLRDTLNLLADIFNGDLNRGVNDFKDLLVDITFGPLITLAEVVDKLMGTHLADWFKDLKEQLKNLDLTKLQGFEKLQAAIENVKGAFDKLKEALQKFGKMLDETGISDAIKQFVVWLVSTGFDVLLQGIATALNIIADAMTIVADILSGDFYSALNDIKNLLATLSFQPLETLASVFDSIFGTDIAGWLGEAEKAVKDFDLSGWLGDMGTAIGNFFTKDIPEFWSEAKSWWNENAGEGILIEVFVSLVKKGWSTVKNWIGNIPVISQGIDLVKKGWQTVKGWVGNIPTLDQAIQLVKEGWKSVKTWVGNIPVLSQAINLIKRGWTTVKNWIGNIPTLSQAIDLIKNGWSTVKSWIENSIGGAVNKAVGLVKNAWSTVSNWVSQYIGGSVSVTVNLLKGWWGSIKNWLGLSDGGTISASGAFKLMADGGIITPNSFWQSIPKYAGGASLHGSMFLAGENGAEMVGHVNGTTEVLNRFQMGQIMHRSIIAGMAQFLPIWRMLNSTLVTSANAIIRSVLVSADAVNSHFAAQVTYDPSNFLSQSVYDESESVYRNSRDESTMASTMRDFYREYVEPTLREIATDAKRQADKEEKTIVQIGNRIINDAVVTQQKANGYVFAK